MWRLWWSLSLIDAKEWTLINSDVAIRGLHCWCFHWYSGLTLPRPTEAWNNVLNMYIQVGIIIYKGSIKIFSIRIKWLEELRPIWQHNLLISSNLFIFIDQYLFSKINDVIFRDIEKYEKTLEYWWQIFKQRECCWCDYDDADACKLLW